MLTSARKVRPPGRGGRWGVAVLGLALASVDPHAAVFAQSPPASPDSTYAPAPSSAPAAPSLPPRRVVPLPPERTAPPVAGALPDGRLECGWVGTRIISLLVRDDIDGANQYRQFYSAFGCSGEQLAQAFRCTVGGGSELAGAPLNERIAGCWANPGMSRPLVAPPAKADTDAAPADGARR